MKPKMLVSFSCEIGSLDTVISLSSAMSIALLPVFIGGCVSHDSTPNPTIMGNPVGRATEQGRPLHEYVEGLVTSKGFAGVVLVARDGEILLHEAYGAAFRPTERPNTTTTVFDAGSVVKQYTAAAILLLESDGLLSTQDSLDQFFEISDSAKRGITLHQLLTHTSGLQRFHGGDLDRVSREKAERRILSAKLRFAPGEGTYYSNSAYSLLAMIVEQVSGKTYQEFVKDHLFEPAGMTSTGFWGDPRWQDTGTAHGYVGARDRGSPANWPVPSWSILGNGGLVTTAGDLHKWAQSLTGDTSSFRGIDARMTQGYAPENSYRYGYAWRVWNEEGLLQWGGNGDFGHNAQIRRRLNPAVIVFITSNVELWTDDDLPLSFEIARVLTELSSGS